MKIILKVQERSHTSLLFRGPSWTKPMMSSIYISQFIEDTIQQNRFTRPKLDSKQEQLSITKARLWWFGNAKTCWIDQMHEPRTASQPTRMDRVMGFAKLHTKHEDVPYFRNLFRTWFSNHTNTVVPTRAIKFLLNKYCKINLPRTQYEVWVDIYNTSSKGYVYLSNLLPSLSVVLIQTRIYHMNLESCASTKNAYWHNVSDQQIM